jgi:hypothetical protein
MTELIMTTSAFCLGTCLGVVLGLWLKNLWLAQDAADGITHVRGHPYSLRPYNPSEETDL